jgi:hypothetical protein
LGVRSILNLRYLNSQLEIIFSELRTNYSELFVIDITRLFGSSFLTG